MAALVMVVMRFIGRFFGGLYWPTVQLDEACLDMAWSWAFITMTRKRRDDPGSGYRLHKQSFLKFMVFAAGVLVGVCILYFMPYWQPWSTIGLFAIGNVFHSLIPLRRSFTEVRAGMVGRTDSSFEKFIRDYALRFVAGALIGIFLQFASWLGTQFGSTWGTVLSAAYGILIALEIVRAIQRERIRKEINSPKE